MMTSKSDGVKKKTQGALELNQAGQIWSPAGVHTRPLFDRPCVARSESPLRRTRALQRPSLCRGLTGLGTFSRGDGSSSWIRTRVSGVRGRCPTAGRNCCEFFCEGRALEAEADGPALVADHSGVEGLAASSSGSHTSSLTLKRPEVNPTAAVRTLFRHELEGPSDHVAVRAAEEPAVLPLVAGQPAQGQVAPRTD